MANGFSYTSSHEWANLGQGAPEVGPIPNAPPRPDTVPLPLDSLEYAPTTGVKGTAIYFSLYGSALPYLSPALREAVAHLYNETYRKGKHSQYTYENVCIVPGGRAGLSRLAAVIGDVYTVRAAYYDLITPHTLRLHPSARAIKYQIIPLTTRF